MNRQTLEATARMMVADGKGLLAIDESTGTCNKRFTKGNIPQTAEAHRQYRELIVNTPGLNESISSAILYDETIRQKKDDGTPFAKALAAVGIIPGIKVDLGAKEMAAFPGEKVTEGLDGSVEPGNAAAFLGQDGIDGVLIGGASLKADEFLAIVNAGIRETEAEMQPT